MSRIRIFALLATLAMLATAFAACGGGGDSSSEDPQTVIDNATLEGVTSGRLDSRSGSSPKAPKAATSKSASPARSRAAAREPAGVRGQRQANGTLKGEAVDFEGGLTLLSDRGFVN